MADPKIAAKVPAIVNLEPGEYYWCACGESKNQPFCEGSHKGSEFSHVQFKIDVKKDVFLCQCKHSGNKPFCDGSHKNV